MPTQEQRRIFRRALAEARRRRGLSQRDLAAAVEVSPSAVSQWEAGDTAPRPQVAAKLEAVLDLEAGSLGRLLGLLPVSPAQTGVTGVLDALDADTKLSDRQRKLLAGIYEELIGDGGRDPAAE